MDASDDAAVLAAHCAAKVCLTSKTCVNAYNIIIRVTLECEMSHITALTNMPQIEYLNTTTVSNTTLE